MYPIGRPLIKHEIISSYQVTPVCGLVGPRQCGKTTLAREIASSYQGNVYFFDLEDERDQNKMLEPLLLLEPLEGLIIIDEVHHAPNLFKTLRVLVDQHKKRQFLILGSASQSLLKQTSESLAGRITYVEMTPFGMKDVPNTLLLQERGGFPLSYLASSTKISMSWRRSYIKTFLERDIPDLGIHLSSHNLRRFWIMLAHYHGQLFNASEIGMSLGINYKTAQNYLDILEATFMIRRLVPWIVNIKKRQIKSPKIYFRDSGLLHTLLGIDTMEGLLGHPKLGLSWEGFSIEEIIRAHKADSESCFYWRTQQGAELDLLLLQNGKLVGYEFKYTSKPSLSKSIYSSLEDIKLESIFIIIPGDAAYDLHPKVHVRGLNNYIASIPS